MSKRFSCQGSFDALGGVYCAAHVIASFGVKDRSTLRNHRTLYQERAKAAFAHLLGSLEQLGLLKAHRIAQGGADCGYTDRELESMINHLDEVKREGLSALAFTRPAVENLRPEQKSRFIGENVSAIIDDGEAGQWIAVTAQKLSSEYLYYEPSPVIAVGSQFRSTWHKGLFVGRLPSPLTNGV